MNVASLDLCRELYELTGGQKTLRSWHDTSLAWADMAIEHEPPAKPIWEPRVVKNDFQALCDFVPAYNLGYLLRKLPEGVAIKKNPQRSEGRDYICFQIDTDYRENQYADTPEDSACKLAIQLFKQSILKKEVNQ